MEKNVTSDDKKSRILDLIKEAELKAELEHENGDPLGTAFKLDELNRNKRNNKKSRTYSRSTENKKTRKRKSPGRGIG